MKIALSKPYKFEDKTYEDVDLDLEGMTGEDMLAVNKQFVSDGRQSLVPTADMNFHVYYAARAGKLPVEFFLQMPAKDFGNIMQVVSNFLILSDSD